MTPIRTPPSPIAPAADCLAFKCAGCSRSRLHMRQRSQAAARTHVRTRPAHERRSRGSGEQTTSCRFTLSLLNLDTPLNERMWDMGALWPREPLRRMWSLCCSRRQVTRRCVRDWRLVLFGPARTRIAEPEADLAAGCNSRSELYEARQLHRVGVSERRWRSQWSAVSQRSAASRRSAVSQRSAQRQRAPDCCGFRKRGGEQHSEAAAA
jgi:hypothetical protein